MIIGQKELSIMLNAKVISSKGFTSPEPLIEVDEKSITFTWPATDEGYDASIAFTDWLNESPKYKNIYVILSGCGRVNIRRKDA